MKTSLVILMLFSLLIACNPDQSGKPEEVDSTIVSETIKEKTPTDSVKAVTPDYSFKEIIRTLPENKKDLDYNETFFSNYAAIQSEMTKMTKVACVPRMFPESVTCYDTVYFAWKMSINEFTLVSFMTLDWNAKGPSIVYNLMTVENATGELIACLPDWAASYSFPVENPEGGTSAGEKFVPGSITNNPVLRISTVNETDENSTFELSPDGFFVEPYAQFDAETNLQ